MFSPPLDEKNETRRMSRKLYGIPRRYSNRNERIVAICPRVSPHL